MDLSGLQLNQARKNRRTRRSGKSAHFAHHLQHRHCGRHRSDRKRPSQTASGVRASDEKSTSPRGAIRGPLVSRRPLPNASGHPTRWAGPREWWCLRAGIDHDIAVKLPDAFAHASEPHAAPARLGRNSKSDLIRERLEEGPRRKQHSSSLEAIADLVGSGDGFAERSARAQQGISEGERVSEEARSLRQVSSLRSRDRGTNA